MFGSRIEVVSGRSVVNYAASTVNTLNISPNSVFPRILAIADVFQFYRFTKLKITNIPLDTSVVFGYAPGALFDTPPANSQSIIELPMAVWHGSAKFADTILTIPRSELIKEAQLPWFKTIVGTPSAQFEIQGNLYTSVGAGANGATLVLEYTVEFQSWNLAGNSPLKPLSLAANTTSVKASPNSKSSLSICSQEQPTDVTADGETSSVVVNGIVYKRSSA